LGNLPSFYEYIVMLVVDRLIVAVTTFQSCKTFIFVK